MLTKQNLPIAIFTRSKKFFITTNISSYSNCTLLLFASSSELKVGLVAASEFIEADDSEFVCVQIMSGTVGLEGVNISMQASGGTATKSGGKLRTCVSDRGQFSNHELTLCVSCAE